MNPARESAQSSIIDNQNANTLQIRIQEISGRAQELWIATAFFTLDAKAADVSELEAELDARGERLCFHQHEPPTYDKRVCQEQPDHKAQEEDEK